MVSGAEECDHGQEGPPGVGWCVVGGVDKGPTRRIYRLRLGWSRSRRWCCRTPALCALDLSHVWYLRVDGRGEQASACLLSSGARGMERSTRERDPNKATHDRSGRAVMSSGGRRILRRGRSPGEADLGRMIVTWFLSTPTTCCQKLPTHNG